MTASYGSDLLRSTHGRSDTTEVEHVGPRSQTLSTSPMSWSTSSNNVTPADGNSRKCSPSTRGSRQCQDPPLARRAAGGAPPASARATPTSLRTPLGSWLGRSSAYCAMPSRLERIVYRLPRRGRPARPAHQVEHAAPPGLPDVRDVEVLPDGEVLEELKGLERPAEAARHPLVGAQAAQRAAVEGDVPLRVRQEPADGLDERGLAGPVRADEAEDLALADVKGDAVETRPSRCTAQAARRRKAAPVARQARRSPFRPLGRRLGFRTGPASFSPHTGPLSSRVSPAGRDCVRRRCHPAPVRNDLLWDTNNDGHGQPAGGPRRRSSCRALPRAAGAARPPSRSGTRPPTP